MSLLSSPFLISLLFEPFWLTQTLSGGENANCLLTISVDSIFQCPTYLRNTPVYYRTNCLWLTWLWFSCCMLIICLQKLVLSWTIVTPFSILIFYYVVTFHISNFSPDFFVKKLLYLYVPWIHLEIPCCRFF